MSRWIYAGLIGLVTGWIARALLPGNDSMGFVWTTIFGVGGSYAGTFIGQKMGKLGASQVGGMLWSVIGAMVLLLLNRIVF
jgi:uncharacterized membrane protein YeaQ/YmgE (transglycosylase-associated protein family)